MVSFLKRANRFGGLRVESSAFGVALLILQQTYVNDNSDGALFVCGMIQTFSFHRMEDLDVKM